MKRIGMILAIVALLSVTLVGYGQEDSNPDLVLAQLEALHPEGVEYDAERGEFLVGSLALGGVWSVADDGTVSPLVENTTELVTIGIHIDDENGRVLVATSDPTALQSGATGTAAVGAYDLETGEELFFVELNELYPDGRHFANDVTVDEEGNAYVTDSLSPVIYVVDMDGNAEIFIESEDLTNPNFGLNGIDYYEGNIFAAVAGAGAVYRIPVESPEDLAAVELSEPLGFDGIVIDDNGAMIGIAPTEVDGTQYSVVVVESGDDWMSGTVIDRGEAVPELSPTTVAIRDGDVYAVHAHFSALFGGSPDSEFEILRIDLEYSADMDDMGDDDMGEDDDMGDDDMSEDDAEATEEPSDS